jgi:5,10-methylenetetrahydrofolate reductase
MKDEADFLFAQVGFSWDHLLRWRESVIFNGPVYAGVMVVASAGMGRKLSADIPQLAIPEWLLSRLADDPSAGIDHAYEMSRRSEAQTPSPVYTSFQSAATGRSQRLQALLRRTM